MALHVNWHASWIAVYVNDQGLSEYLGPLGLVSGGPTGHLLDQAGVSRITLLDPLAFGGPGETLLGNGWFAEIELSQLSQNGPAKKQLEP